MTSAIVYTHRCIEALIAMGVLVDGGDRVSIRRTAVFFLNSFEVRPRSLGFRVLQQPMLSGFSSVTAWLAHPTPV